MKTVLKVLGALALVLVLAVCGVYGWASMKDRSLLSRHIAVHDVDFPIPFPLSTDEAAQVQAASFASAGATSSSDAAAAPDLAAVALQQAVERGRHLVQARYGCAECHGQNFGGGTMIDAAPIGRILGPNITTGKGSRTLSYTAKDWDHIVRHGVKPDGTPAAMPSSDFKLMSDQELSDIVAYIRFMPPVDAEVPRPTLGPVGKVLMATGKLPLSADLITDHQSPHLVHPPAAEPTAKYGEHLAGVCTGCHGERLSGGPVPGGDPSWPPAANLTPGGDLGSWSYDDFVRAITEAKRPDGTALRPPDEPHDRLRRADDRRGESGAVGVPADGPGGAGGRVTGAARVLGFCAGGSPARPLAFNHPVDARAR